MRTRFHLSALPFLSLIGFILMLATGPSRQRLNLAARTTVAHS